MPMLPTHVPQHGATQAATGYPSGVAAQPCPQQFQWGGLPGCAGGVAGVAVGGGSVLSGQHPLAGFGFGCSGAAGQAAFPQVVPNPAAQTPSPLGGACQTQSSVQVTGPGKNTRCLKVRHTH